MPMEHAKRTYKDGLFRFYMSEPENRLALCRTFTDLNLSPEDISEFTLENKAQGMALEQGILKAIKDCHADGTMADFLEQHHGEVFGMVSLQWDEETARKFYESEARAEEKESTIVDNLRKMIKNSNMSMQQVMDMLEIPVKEREKYAALI